MAKWRATPRFLPSLYGEPPISRRFIAAIYQFDLAMRHQLNSAGPSFLCTSNHAAEASGRDDLKKSARRFRNPNQKLLNQPGKAQIQTFESILGRPLRRSLTPTFPDPAFDVTIAGTAGAAVPTAFLFDEGAPDAVVSPGA